MNRSVAIRVVVVVALVGSACSDEEAPSPPPEPSSSTTDRVSTTSSTVPSSTGAPTTVSSTLAPTTSTTAADGAAELGGLFGEFFWQILDEMIADSELPIPITRADANCVGRALVALVGYEEFRDAGITVEAVRRNPDILAESDIPGTPPDGLVIYDTILAPCFDYPQLLAGAIASTTGISEESAACVVAGLLEDERIRRSLGEGLVTGQFAALDTTDPASADLASGLLIECLTADEIARLTQ